MSQWGFERLFAVVACLAFVVVSQSVCRAADKVATTRAVTLPEPAGVRALDDAQLCAVTAAIFPDPDAVFGGYNPNEPETKLKEAVAAELRTRGGRRLAAYLATGTAADLKSADESAVLILLYGLVAEPSGDDTRRRERAEPVVRRALEMGGRARLLALESFPLRDPAGVSDALLRDLLPVAPGGVTFSRYDAGRNRERMLCEIIRRGGKDWEKVLEGELSRIRAAAVAAGKSGEEVWDFDVTPMLETLTALRRVQGKADPIHVEVSGPGEIECVFPSLPKFDVALVNRDPGRVTVPFTEGGDYRSGRQARWRIEARDAAGAMMPLRSANWGMGGGLFQYGKLAPGEDWKTKLNMGSFVAALPPGCYSLRVLYHDLVCIADEGDVSGLIVSSSDLQKLTVRPLDIARKEVDAANVRGLLDGIDERATVKVIAGTYGEWAHELVAGDSSQGRLLSVGLPALPTLLDVLEEPKLNPKRRAIVLSLLFSLTGQLDPRPEHGVLGGYTSVDGPWRIASAHSAGMGWGSSSADGGEIDEAAQRAFAKRWSAWKAYVKVVENPSTPGK